MRAGGFAFTVSLALALTMGGGVRAQQDFPSRPITIIAPSAPGGVVDLIARTLADRLSKAWGQTAIVENRPGANHQIGASFVGKGAADGYTLLVSPEGPFVASPYLSKEPGPDLMKELIPVSGLFSTEAALVVSKKLGVDDLKGLLTLARAKPGGLNYGTFGFGSSGHLAMEMLQNMADIKLVPVHYKGATPAFTDVLGGHIEAMFVNPATAAGAASKDLVKLVGIASKARLEQYADVPAIAEIVPGFTAGSWFGLFTAAGTPGAVVAKINREIQTMQTEMIAQKNFLRTNTFTPMQGSPEDFARFIREDAAKWQAVIKAAKIAPQ